MSYSEPAENSRDRGANARTTVRRVAKRGVYDRETIYAILDEGFLCHVGFVDAETPYVIPTLYARDGDRLILHGSPASRMLKRLREGLEVCVTVTLVDGMVLARSVFHHSINYRSVVLLGRAQLLDAPEEKMAAMKRLVEHVTPGRWEDARQPNEQEFRGTMVLALPIDEASAKVRTGGPVDDDEDYALPVWAGVVPLSLVPGTPVPDDRLTEGTPAPDYLSGIGRRGR